MVWFFYILLIGCGYLIHFYSSEASVIYASAVDQLGFSGQTEIAWKTFIEKFTFNLYEGASEKIFEIQALQEAARVDMRYATYLSITFLVLTFILLAFQVYMARKYNHKERIVFHMIIIAMICLAIGITTPILNLVAFKEIPVLGTVIFKYDSKSIIGVILKLFASKNIFVGLLILLFSVITPVVKSILSLTVYTTVNINIRRKSLNIIKLIGKWSMTDVFVVALLLAFFSLSIDKTTDAWLSHGLYFFSAYVILSIITGHMLLVSKWRKEDLQV